MPIIQVSDNTYTKYTIPTKEVQVDDFLNIERTYYKILEVAETPKRMKFTVKKENNKTDIVYYAKDTKVDIEKITGKKYKDILVITKEEADMIRNSGDDAFKQRWDEGISVDRYQGNMPVIILHTLVYEFSTKNLAPETVKLIKTILLNYDYTIDGKTNIRNL